MHMTLLVKNSPASAHLKDKEFIYTVTQSIRDYLYSHTVNQRLSIQSHSQSDLSIQSHSQSDKEIYLYSHTVNQRDL